MRKFNLLDFSDEQEIFTDIESVEEACEFLATIPPREVEILEAFWDRYAPEDPEAKALVTLLRGQQFDCWTKFFSADEFICSVRNLDIKLQTDHIQPLRIPTPGAEYVQ